MWVSLLLLAVLAAGTVWLLRRKELDRRAKPAMSGTLEYRTDLAFDECLDALRSPTPEDEFVYTCQRDRDGSFLLHLTLHQPTRQPLDTLYSLRLDSGKQTVVTLIFLREAFGYGQPVFGQEVLDRFLARKLQAVPSPAQPFSEK